MDKYTSLELSKKLKEGGCKLSSVWHWAVYKNGDVKLDGEHHGDLIQSSVNPKYYPAYDILNDICVKYAKEFFGDKDVELEELKLATELYDVTGSLEYLMYRGKTCQYYPSQIMLLLQQNKRQEAEDYIWKHCLFNKK